MEKENFNGIVLREKERKLSISRIPKQVKEEFTNFADEEFCSDYGLCFKHVFDGYKMWKLFFENTDMKLDIIIDKLNNVGEQKPEENGITLLSGRTVLKGGKK